METHLVFLDKFKNPFSNMDRFLTKWLQIQLQEFKSVCMDLGSCEHNDVIQINENNGKYKHKNWWRHRLKF